MAYIPMQVPTDPAQLPGFLLQELQNIARSTDTSIAHLSELNKAPAKPRAGMVVLADGVFFNPGSGAGFYGYRAGAWHFLG